MENLCLEWMPENRDKKKYVKEMERIFAGFGEEKPALLLHACCAPCSSYSLEVLSPHFRKIDIWFYNPNITPAAEYEIRLAELRRLVETVPYGCPVTVLDTPYDPAAFFAMAKGRENLPEGGVRCLSCYELRLRSTAEMAAGGGYDWFTTTLSISPHKNAHWLNSIGIRMGETCGVPYLVSDFKKNGGYARSVALSETYGLYRQNWCGCVYSRRAAEGQNAEKIVENNGNNDIR